MSIPRVRFSAGAMIDSPPYKGGGLGGGLIALHAAGRTPLDPPLQRGDDPCVFGQSCDDPLAYVLLAYGVTMPIEAERLTVRRLATTVLRDVSLTIADGDCVSIIGPNGAGKSTLMSALAGLLPIAEGRVLLDGRPLRDYGRRAIARRIAYVPQWADGYLGFRVRDVIESGRYAYLEPLTPPTPDDRNAVERAVRACKVDALLDRRIETLSGGERQKVWIAAALAQQAPALFLDEPTTALDPAHQVDLIRIMRSFAAEGGTLLVICHDLNIPLALGGRVVALREGQVLFDEPVDVLQQIDRLRALFGTGFALHRSSNGQRWSVHLQWETS